MTMTVDATASTASAPLVSARTDRAIRLWSTLAIVAVALAAGVLSWHGLSALAVSVEVPENLGWLFAVSTDGMMLAGSLAVLHSTLRANRALFPWTVVTLGAALSIYGNVRSAPAGWDSAIVHASAPIALLLSLEMLFRLLRHRITAAQVAAQEAAQVEQARLAREAKAAQRARTAPSTTPRKSTVKAKTATAAVQKTEIVGETTGEKPSTAAAPKALAADSSDREQLRSQAHALREQGLSYGKIATEISVPVSTVKRWAADAA